MTLSRKAGSQGRFIWNIETNKNTELMTTIAKSMTVFLQKDTGEHISVSLRVLS